MGWGRPRSFETAQDLEDQIAEYFTGNERPTMAGVCLHLGICKDTWSKYGKGDYDDENNNFSDLVKRGRKSVEEKVEERLLYDNAGAGPIFWLKNHGGYQDKTTTEHDVTPDAARFVMNLGNNV